MYDPWIDADEAQHEYGFRPIAAPEPGAYDAVILAVGHKVFRDLGADAIRAYGKASHVFFDVKALFPKHASDLRL